MGSAPPLVSPWFWLFLFPLFPDSNSLSGSTRLSINFIVFLLSLSSLSSFSSSLFRSILFVRLHSLVHQFHCVSLVLVLAVFLLIFLVQVNTVFWDVSHLHSWSVWQHSEILQQPGPDLVHILRGVLVGHVTRSDMKFEVRAKIFKVIIVRQLVGDVLLQSHTCLECPASGHISDGVASTSQQHQGQVVSLHKLHALSMALKCQVETPKSVS